jgi:hypothetical protein
MRLRIEGRRLLGNAGLDQTLREHLAMGEAAQIVAQHAHPQRRPDPVAAGGEIRRLLDQAEMPAAADERIVVPSELSIGATDARRCGSASSKRPAASNARPWIVV